MRPTVLVAVPLVDDYVNRGNFFDSLGCGAAACTMTGRRHFMTRTLSIILAGLALALTMGAGAARADDGIRIDHAWARATPGGAKTGAIYLTITNTGSAPDTIEGASTPAADKTELHEMTMVNGVMEMRPVASLSIDPGKSLTLKPNGYHLMLLGLKAPLKAGQTLPVTVMFKHAGAQQATVSVAKIGAMHAGDTGTGSDMSGEKSDMSDMPGMKH